MLKGRFRKEKLSNHSFKLYILYFCFLILDFSHKKRRSQIFSAACLIVLICQPFPKSIIAILQIFCTGNCIWNLKYECVCRLKILDSFDVRWIWFVSSRFRFEWTYSERIKYLQDEKKHFVKSSKQQSNPLFTKKIHFFCNLRWCFFGLP